MLSPVREDSFDAEVVGFDQATIGSDDIAGLQNQHIPRHNVVCFHLLPLSVAQHPGGLFSPLLQGLNDVLRLAFGEVADDGVDAHDSENDGSIHQPPRRGGEDRGSAQQGHRQTLKLLDEDTEVGAGLGFGEAVGTVLTLLRRRRIFREPPIRDRFLSLLRRPLHPACASLFRADLSPGGRIYPAFFLPFFFALEGFCDFA